MTDIKHALRQAQGTFESDPDPYGRWLRRQERRRRNRRLIAGFVGALLALGVIVVLVVAASLRGARQPLGSAQEGSVQNGLIAYADGSRLFSIPPDGTGNAQIIPTPPGGPWQVAWSPDGSKLAVTIFPAGAGARTVWVMNADGSDPVQVASGTNVSQASWSPDGKQLAVAVQANGGSAIHLVNADGSGDHIVSPVVTGADVNYLDVAWSPDGARIASARGTDSGFDIFVLNADGSGMVQLTHDGHDYNPAWSPDGSQIAFTRQGTGPQSDIYVMDADGSHVRQLTNDGEGTTNLNPQWSPDGTKIAYVAGKSGGPGPLVTMNPDGSHKVVLVKGDLVGFSWQTVFGPSLHATAASYVEGARPAAGEGLAGCVQWSADRPDVHICGSLPATYSPAPAPYYDAKICSSAEDWLAAKRADLATGGTAASEINADYPTETPSSCLVVQETSGPIWMVVFRASDSTQPNIHVPYAPNGDVSWAAHP